MSFLDDMKVGMIDSVVETFQTFDTYLNNSYGLLTTDVFSGEWLEISSRIADIVAPTAITIAGICFFIEFLSMTINLDILKWEYLLKVFGKFCIARASIGISGDALRSVFRTVSGWITSVTTGTISVGTTLASSAQTTLNSADFGVVFAMYLSSMIFIAFLKIIGICINVMGYARAFELTCVNSVAPLPFAFLCLDSNRGMNVFKNFAFVYIGICLRGLFMVISLSVFCTLASNISFASWSTGLSDLLVLSLVLLMALVKSDQWAKQLFNG